MEGQFAAIMPPDLKDRISFQVHDFFTPQPVAADVYFMRWILHDWSDKYAIRIIRNIVPAMKPGSRIVIMETVLQPPGKLSFIGERMATSSDLQMMVACMSRERTADDWKQLVGQAESRLRFVDVVQPAGSTLGAVEFILDE